MRHKSESVMVNCETSLTEVGWVGALSWKTPINITLSVCTPSQKVVDTVSTKAGFTNMTLHKHKGANSIFQ